MEISPEPTHEDFFRENFIAPGVKMWVQGAYKYAGYGLILYGVCFTIVGIIVLIAAFISRNDFLYALFGSSLIIAWVLGFGSLKLRRWAIIAWIAVAVAFTIGLFTIPYGLELWFPALFSICIAIAGFCYRDSFIKGGWVGVILSMFIIAAALVFVAALSRPEFFGGPTVQDRQQAVAKFFTPESFIQTTKGKTVIMQLYGYSTSNIISDDISNAQLLQQVQQNPAPFNSLVYSINHSFEGYVDSLFLALVDRASL